MEHGPQMTSSLSSARERIETASSRPREAVASEERGYDDSVYILFDPPQMDWGGKTDGWHFILQERG